MVIVIVAAVQEWPDAVFERQQRSTNWEKLVTRYISEIILFLINCTQIEHFKRRSIITYRYRLRRDRTTSIWPR